MANLSGTWLGTYWQQTNPTRFEATFIQGGNTLSGNILDGNYLGEATLSGKVIGHKINFRSLPSGLNGIYIDHQKEQIIGASDPRRIGTAKGE